MPQNSTPLPEMIIKRTPLSDVFMILCSAGLTIFLSFSPVRRQTLLHPDSIISGIFLITSVIFLPIYCMYRLLFTRLQATITHEGLWTRKGGMFLWKDIWYVNAFIVESRRGIGYYLNVKLKEEVIASGVREVRIEVTDRKYKPQDIYNLVMQYAEKHSIINLGNTDLIQGN